MNLDEFLYKLHYETDQVKPPDWEVDWEDAPLPYKLYQGLPTVELPEPLPLHHESMSEKAAPSLQDISTFLKYTFGLAQVSQTMPFAGETEEWTALRRYVPSGGGLYPSELYLYLKIVDLTEGIYHYDAAHHRLFLLRKGNFDVYLTKALGNNNNFANGFGAVFLSTFFWKNFFKYNNFSYRLQGLDAGFLIGQMLETGRRCGLDSAVNYQFLDRSLNHLLGLSEQEESVYAVIPFSKEPTMNEKVQSTATADALCSEIPPLAHQHYVRSRTIREYPILLEMNEACLLETFPAKKTLIHEEKSEAKQTVHQLPRVERLSYDFTSSCRIRYSPGMDFVQKPMDENTLASLLFQAFSTFSHVNDLDSAASNLSLYCCTYQIKGIPNGCYRYNLANHALELIQAGDFRCQLQDGLLADTVNMSQVPLSITIVGSKDHYRDSYGYRGHRIQHMEAGILSQHLLLAASALSIGGHPLLGFDVHSYDELFHLKQKGETSLLQIPMGYFRPHPRLQGSLY